MSILNNIIAILDAGNMYYEKLEHAPVYTSEQAAEIRDASLDTGAKALVFLADKKPILVVVPGDKRANLSKIKKRLGVKDLRMATREQVEELTTLKPGSIPPVGTAMGLPSYYDESFRDKDKVAFNAGSLTVSIIMSAQDLLNIEKPVLFDLV